jgi:predicted dehydrogenase
VRATLPLLKRPMFFEVHRLSVFSPRALDVDVVLDLMIHDLDVVLTFVKSPVKEIRAVGLPILSGKVDIANVRVEFESGCVANFTASRVSTERVRKLRFFQAGQYISIDYGRQDVLVLSVGSAHGAHSFAKNANEWGTRGHGSSRCDSRTFPANSQVLCLRSSQTVNLVLFSSVYSKYGCAV